jgi:hypothetical protein
VLQFAQASEARRHPRTGQRERKLQIKADDVQPFERRLVDRLGTHLSGEPRVLSNSFLKRLGRHAPITDIAQDFKSRRYKPGARVANCTLQVKFLFRVRDTAARRYCFSRGLLQCPCDPVATLPAHLSMPGGGSVPPPRA